MVLLIAEVVVFAVSVPEIVRVCAAAFEIVPDVAVPILPATPVAFVIDHVVPTWLAGTEMVYSVSEVVAAVLVCELLDWLQVATLLAECVMVCVSFVLPL